MNEIVTHIFTIVDDFCNAFQSEFEGRLLSKRISKSKGPKCNMAMSEIMAIVLLFQLSEARHFKGFYKQLEQHHRNEFPKLVSYSRFVSLIQSVTIPLVGFFEFVKGVETDEYFVDSTALSVCKNKRISGHKVFASSAKRGKGSMGWFFGFKFHLICNQQGAPVRFRLTAGNRDDRAVARKMMSGLKGIIVGDKGYISKDLFSEMFGKGLRVVTALRSKMKANIVTEKDSEMISGRSLIESVFNVLKNTMHLEHSRHRSQSNFLVNVLSSVCAFAIRGMNKTAFEENCLANKML